MQVLGAMLNDSVFRALTLYRTLFGFCLTVEYTVPNRGIKLIPESSENGSESYSVIDHDHVRVLKLASYHVSSNSSYSALISSEMRCSVAETDVGVELPNEDRSSIPLYRVSNVVSEIRLVFLPTTFVTLDHISCRVDNGAIDTSHHVVKNANIYALGIGLAALADSYFIRPHRHRSEKLRVDADDPVVLERDVMHRSHLDTYSNEHEYGVVHKSLVSRVIEGDSYSEAVMDSAV